ncbi:MAG: hypothetical protein DMG03_21725 [Acidobacteria bacterium]|nr:MAG: hypothetical protein DMG03_21725 [Acidobacteriota bacterium]
MVITDPVVGRLAPARTVMESLEANLGARRVMVITDPVVGRLAPARTVMESLEANRVPAVLYDRVRVEPTDESFLDATAFAKDGGYDAFVAVGGGSTIDTAKAVNLYTTYPPDDFLDYVNPPIGKGLPVPGPLKPLMAIPTTAGTGSETTGVSIFDLTKMHAKTGIANRRLKPTLGYLDPTRPAASAAGANEFRPFGDARNCTAYDKWPYGLQNRSGGYASRLTDDQLKQQLVSRPTTYLVGEYDTLPLAGFDSSCPAMAQGPNRLARGQAFGRYVNEKLGAHHTTTVVPLCGHNARCMFTADPVLKLVFPTPSS